MSQGSERKRVVLTFLAAGCGRLPSMNTLAGQRFRFGARPAYGLILRVECDSVKT